MTRQLATMITSGMTLLRAFYVLEDQIENKKLARRSAPSARTSSPASPSPRRSPSTRRSSRRSTSRWSAPARPAACSRRRWTGSPTSSRRTTQLRRQVKGAMAYPIVVLALRPLRADRPDRVHRPGVRQGLRRLRRRAAADHQVHRRSSPTSSRATGTCCIGGRHRRPDRLQEVAHVHDGAASSGTVIRLQVPVQDRRDRPEDRPRALVAHLRRALLRRRADHAGDRDHRPDRRQLRRREGDGRRHRVRQVRRLDRRPAQGSPDLPRRWSPR